MIREVAYVPVLADSHENFVRDLQKAASEILPHAQGFMSFEAVGWGVERPDVFMFTINWETIEDHMIGFRESELFTQWRALIGPHFSGTPTVEHFEVLSRE